MLVVATALAAPLLAALQGMYIDAGNHIALLALLPLAALVLVTLLFARSGLRLARRAMVAAAIALAGYALLPQLDQGLEHVQQAIACLPAGC